MHEAAVVGASALGSVKRPCRAIHEAMTDAGIREDVIFIVGGWGISQAWSDDVGADAFGEDAVDALDKVKALLRGDLPRWGDKVNEQRELPAESSRAGPAATELDHTAEEPASP